MSDATIDTLFGARTALVIDDAVDAATCAAFRAGLDYTRYALVDRGSYDFAEVPRAAVELVERLVSARIGRPLRAESARALRLRAGDYLLARHDHVHEGLPFEAILDVSPAPAAGEVHYRRRGQVFFRVPSLPGSLAIVERGPTVTCNHTYVTKRQPHAEVVRLVVLLRD